MAKADEYVAALSTTPDIDAFLREHSGLPGPRSNLELLSVAADTAGTEDIDRWLALDSSRAPTNTPDEFLAACGIVALGRLICQGNPARVGTLRRCASDSRWRAREAVAMALQRWARHDPSAMADEVSHWAAGNRLEQRAAAAGMCEPDLLVDASFASRTLNILDRITSTIADASDRRSEEFKALRKGLGYCWSVAICGMPERGKPMFERLLASDDPDVRWIVKENLKKKRLERLDAEWVAKMHNTLERTGAR